MKTSQPPLAGTPAPTRDGEPLPTRSRWTARVDAADLSRLAALVAVPAGRPGFDVHAPFTGERIGAVPHCAPGDVADAVSRARDAQRTWAATPLRHRSRILLRFHDLVYRRRDFLVDLIQLESGKARRDAFDEVADLLNTTRYYARSARRHLRSRRRAGAVPLLTATREHHHPIGVVGIIAPWNYPLTIPLSDSVPALLAGNAVILKPSQLTPFTALAGLELLRDAGLPDALLQVITAPGAAAGAAVLDYVDYVAFTGSSDTGRTVGARAGERLIGASLELGGKNCMIVLGDAHLAGTVRGAVRNCFASAGQLCMSAERIYVHASLYDAFVDAFVERTRALRLGARFDYDFDVGCLASEEQLRKVEQHVGDAVRSGARVLTGGRHRPDVGPLFFEPTILAGVTDEMQVATQETFGPVVAIYRFDDPLEAVAHANATRYGLNASVWTGRPRSGRRIALQLHAGTVSVNDAFTATWGSVDAPLGGFKDSGVGRRHGAIGIRRFTETQTVAVQRVRPIAPPDGLGEAGFARAIGMFMRLRRFLPGRY